MTAKFITTPGGEKLAILPAEEYEDMRDALVHQRAMADYRAGRSGALTLDEVQALLAAPTPLAFWRAKRGVTQAALAKAAGTTQPHVADLEFGQARRLTRNHGPHRRGAQCFGRQLGPGLKRTDRLARNLRSGWATLGRRRASWSP